MLLDLGGEAGDGGSRSDVFNQYERITVLSYSQGTVKSVERDPDYEDRSIVRVIMSRTSRHGEVTIKWDWDNMDFTEVTDDDGDDDEEQADGYSDW